MTNYVVINLAHALNKFEVSPNKNITQLQLQLKNYDKTQTAPTTVTEHIQHALHLNASALLSWNV